MCSYVRTYTCVYINLQWKFSPNWITRVLLVPSSIESHPNVSSEQMYRQQWTCVEWTGDISGQCRLSLTTSSIFLCSSWSLTVSTRAELPLCWSVPGGPTPVGTDHPWIAVRHTNNSRTLVNQHSYIIQVANSLSLEHSYIHTTYPAVGPTTGCREQALSREGFLLLLVHMTLDAPNTKG